MAPFHQIAKLVKKRSGDPAVSWVSNRSLLVGHKVTRGTERWLARWRNQCEYGGGTIKAWVMRKTGRVSYIEGLSYIAGMWLVLLRRVEHKIEWKIISSIERYNLLHIPCVSIL